MGVCGHVCACASAFLISEYKSYVLKTSCTVCRRLHASTRSNRKNRQVERKIQEVRNKEVNEIDHKTGGDLRGVIKTTITTTQPKFYHIRVYALIVIVGLTR